MDRGRGARGRVHMRGRSYLRPRPPPVPAHAPYSGRSGWRPRRRSFAVRRLERLAHGGRGSSGQKLGSWPRSRGGGRPGGDVAGAGLDDVSRVGTGTERFPSAGRSTSPSPWSGALEGGEGASWRRMVSAGRARAGSEGGRGLGMTCSSSAAMAARTTPNSSPRAAATSCRLGGSGLSRSGLRVIQRRRRGRALHSPRACRWRSSAASSRSSRQRPVNPEASVERPTGGAVSQLICSRTACCDAGVSRRAPIDAAAEMRVSVAGVVFPHCRAAVVAAAINWPAKPRSAGSRLAAATRASPTSPPEGS